MSEPEREFVDGTVRKARSQAAADRMLSHMDGMARIVADELFAILATGGVKLAAPTRYALADAAQAHADLEGRKTTGSLVLIP